MGNPFFKKMRIGIMVFLVPALLPQVAAADAGFNEKLMEQLPPGVILESLKEAQQKGGLGDRTQAGYMDFGLEVCRALSDGKDKKKIVKKLTPELGAVLANAIYETAIITICPEHKK